MVVYADDIYVIIKFKSNITKVLESQKVRFKENNLKRHYKNNLLDKFCLLQEEQNKSQSPGEFSRIA